MTFKTSPRQARPSVARPGTPHVSRRRIGCALFLTAVALVFAAIWSARAEAGRLVPLDVIVAIDDSGSEFGAHGTDPRALRYEAARFAASFLGSIATAGLDNRVGVVRFGTAAPAD